MGAEDASESKKASGRFVSRLKWERERRAWTQSELAERIGTTQINISRWENGITVPGPHFRQKLVELFGKNLEELGLMPEDGLASTSSSDTSPSSQLIWNVPYRQNLFFTGREEILTQLYSIFRDGNSSGLAVAMSGLGGIGKTQVAIEYAYRYREHYEAIFWVTASTRDALNADFMMLATLLSLPEQDEQDQSIIVRAVKRWLTTHKRWLLILDNVDKLEMVLDFLPTPASGDVLLTTRQHALGTFVQSIEIEKMGLDEGVMFLLRRTRELMPGASLGQVSKESHSRAAEIVTALEGLPLALDQAGAYIEETRCGLAQYLDLYGTRRKELLLRRGSFSMDHPDSVAATWSLSFQQVEQESLAAADLLRLFAFLNEAIPEEIITLGAEELGPTLGQMTGDPLKLDKIIELLLHYSLVRRIPKAKSLSVHRLVQVVLRDGMGEATQRLWAERTIRAVNRAFPDISDLQIRDERQTRERCQRILPHVQICTTYVDEYALAFPEVARLFNGAGIYLVTSGNYEQAEFLLRKTLALRQQLLEANHPEMAHVLNDLGALSVKQGKYSTAESLLQEALTIRKQQLGEKHLDVAQTLYNLANLYRAQGKYREAEPFYLDAMQIREAILRTDHLLVAQSYYGLAKLYYSLEKYQQAEKLCERAIHIQERRLGSNHPVLASMLHILAKIYQGQQRLDQAKQIYMHALQIREDTSGADHPHVAVILNSLVEIYHAEGKYREVEPMIERALRIREQSLGSEHPYMAYSLGNRAENCFLQGDYVHAEFYSKQALTIRERTLGYDHPHTATSYYNLAKLYAFLARYEEAASYYQKTLDIRQRAFGPDHPAATGVQAQYTALLEKAGKKEQDT